MFRWRPAFARTAELVHGARFPIYIGRRALHILPKGEVGAQSLFGPPTMFLSSLACLDPTWHCFGEIALGLISEDSLHIRWDILAASYPRFTDYEAPTDNLYFRKRSYPLVRTPITGQMLFSQGVTVTTGGFEQPGDK